MVTQSDIQHLVLSSSALVFPKTAVGKPSFLILTLTQPTPLAVTLSTDAPDYFTFATDSQPTFAPTQRLTLGPGQTYLHVRYVAERRGLCRGQLLIETPFGSQMVLLEGRCGRRYDLRERPVSAPLQLPAAQKIVGVNSSTTPHRVRSWKAALVVVGVGALVWVGYGQRCVLLPSLCRADAPGQSLSSHNQPVIQAVPAKQPSVVALAAPATAEPVVESNVERRSETRKTAARTKPSSTKKTADRPADVPRRPVADATKTKSTFKLTPPSAQPRPRPATPSPYPAYGESDLERELNKKQ
jgi:hypothetical protein